MQRPLVVSVGGLDIHAPGLGQIGEDVLAPVAGGTVQEGVPGRSLAASCLLQLFLQGAQLAFLNQPAKAPRVTRRGHHLRPG